MEWKRKIWLMIAGAIFTVYLALKVNRYIGIAVLAFYLIFFPLTIKKQFFSKI